MTISITVIITIVITMTITLAIITITLRHSLVLFRLGCSGADTAVQSGCLPTGGVVRAARSDETRMSMHGLSNADSVQLQYKEPHMLVAMATDLRAARAGAIAQNERTRLVDSDQWRFGLPRSALFSRDMRAGLFPSARKIGIQLGVCEG